MSADPSGPEERPGAPSQSSAAGAPERRRASETLELSREERLRLLASHSLMPDRVEDPGAPRAGK